MEVIENTLDTEIDTWTDSGDYPSGAGGYPLPSYQYVADIRGHLTVILTDAELAAWQGEPVQSRHLMETVAEHLADRKVELRDEYPASVTAVTWVVDSIRPNHWVWWWKLDSYIRSLSLVIGIWLVICIAANLAGVHRIPSGWLGLMSVVIGLATGLGPTIWVDHHPLVYEVSLSVADFESGELEYDPEDSYDGYDPADDSY